MPTGGEEGRGVVRQEHAVNMELCESRGGQAVEKDQH